MTDNLKKILYRALEKSDVNMLQYAIQHGVKNICQSLIDAGANLELADNFGNTALCLAAMNEEGLSSILLKAGANVNANYGEALRHAVFFEHTGDVELLLAYKADPNLVDPESKESALHIAAHEGYEDGVRLLVKHGVNTEIENIDGETAFCVAVRREAENVAAFLLSQNTNPEHIDHYGNTPLSWAKRKRNDALISLIQEKIDERQHH